MSRTARLLSAALATCGWWTSRAGAQEFVGAMRVEVEIPAGALPPGPAEAELLSDPDNSLNLEWPVHRIRFDMPEAAVRLRFWPGLRPSQHLALVSGRVTELRASPFSAWVLRVRGDFAIAKLVALGVPAVAKASLVGDLLTVELQTGSADPAEVTTALVQAGIAVIAITEHKTALRDLYNQVVGGPRA